ncbi:phosphoribosylaminoimidazole synthetase [Shouchella miscanthi]|uniref:Phosphoribosylaminoimidazole synthetase n=1 Tax=Shouchella miscanthi TaxID=2598861 RepID=A0ABU6NNJ0_9BACI|nr:phosphoribosylaminoimidazole synthetase [Shouchella miscanthi]
MKVRCLTQEGYLHSPKVVKEGNEDLTNYGEITIGKEYIVYGIIHYEGGFRYLVYDDFETIYWYPAELFEVIDSNLPSNWHFKFFGQNAEPISAIMGYKELLNDDHVDGLAELESEDIEIFLQMKNTAN